MRYLLLIPFLCGCAYIQEGNVVVLKHYYVTNAISATQSNLSTRYVLGTIRSGKQLEITTIEGDAVRDFPK